MRLLHVQSLFYLQQDMELSSKESRILLVLNAIKLRGNLSISTAAKVYNVSRFNITRSRSQQTSTTQYLTQFAKARRIRRGGTCQIYTRTGFPRIPTPTI